MSRATSVDEMLCGSWAYRFVMELVICMSRAGVEVRVSIPEDYASPFRGDVAFHAWCEPTYATFDTVRVAVHSDAVYVRTRLGNGEQTQLARFDGHQTSDPMALATRVWRECVHGAVAWMASHKTESAEVRA